MKNLCPILGLKFLSFRFTFKPDLKMTFAPQGAAETTLTVEDSWGLTPVLPATSLEKLREFVKGLMTPCVQKFGGPENYLRQRYGTRAAKQEWLNYLGELQVVNGVENYTTSVDLPVSSLGFRV